MRFVFFLLFVLSVRVEAAEGPRFYNQAQWGQKSFILERQADGSLQVKMPAPGRYEFSEDEMAVDRWVTIDATWTGLGVSKLRPYVLDDQGNRWLAREPAHEGKNSWTPADFDFVGGAMDQHSDSALKIIQVGWEALALAADQNPVLQSCDLNVTEGKKSLALFNERTSPYPFVLNLPSVPVDLPLPSMATSRVIIPEDARLVALPEWRKKWFEWGLAEFPGHFGIDAGTYIFSDLAQATIEARKEGITTTAEFHRAHPYRIAWTRNNSLNATRFDGFNVAQPVWPPNTGPFDLGQIDDITNEKVFEMTRDKMNVLYDLGFQNVYLIDYTWMYVGGKWGYGDVAVALWKEYLKGGGERVHLVDPDETWSFADYWKTFTSIPLTPDQFGWKTWDDFVCGTEAEARQSDEAARRLLLFNALYHFHYLVFADRLAGVAQKRGRLFEVTPNPEDITNGVDITLLGRLRGLDSIGYEYFGNPKIASVWGHTLSNFRWKKGGAVLDLVGEINAGGGGNSRYDRDVAFAFYYDVTAGSLPRDCNIQYPCGADWTNWKALKPDELDRFDHWFAGSSAFLLRHQEETKENIPRPDQTVIFSRSVLEYQDSSTSTFGQDGNVASYLQALNLPFQCVGRDAWRPERDNYSRTLFFSPSVAQPSELENIKRWIATGEGKTLVLQGGAPWRVDLQPDRPNTAAVAWSPDRSYRESIISSDQSPIVESFLPLKSRHPNTTVKLGGKTLETTYWESGNDTKTLLASDDGLPLITEWNIGKNRVFQVTIDLPARSLSPLGLDVMNRICQLADTSPVADYLEDWSLENYAVPGGNVCVAWNTKILDQQEKSSSAVPNYRPDAALAGILTRFERLSVPQPPIMNLHVAPNRDYVIYSVFDQERSTAHSSNKGILSVTLSHAPQMIYYGESSPAFESTIQKATETYRAVLDRTRKNLNSGPAAVSVDRSPTKGLAEGRN